jgi:hypothetical protein
LIQRLLVALVCLTSVSPLLSADPDLATALSGSWGTRGITRSLVVRDQTLFAADGRGVAAYDISNPAAIRRLSTYESSAETLDLTLAGRDIFVVTKRGIERLSFEGNALRGSVLKDLPGLTAVAATGDFLAAGGPSMMTLMGRSEPGSETTLPLQHPLRAIGFHNGFLYASIESEGVRIYDVHDGTLTQVGILSENVRQMVFAGDMLIAADGPDGLLIADVHDAAAPRVLSHTGAGELTLSKIAVAGHVAYAARQPGAVVTFEIGNPERPVVLGTMPTDVQAIAAAGNDFFIAGSSFDSFGLERSSGVAVRAFDASATAAPSAIGEVDDLAGPLTGVVTDGTYAYVADPPFFRVIWIADPTRPREVANFRYDALQDRVRLKDSTVLVFSRGDVDIVDVRDPLHPFLAGVWHSLGRPPSTAAFGPTTILEANSWSGFHVIDVSDRAHPVQISGLKSEYIDLASFGTTGYLFETGNIRVADLSNEHNAVAVRDVLLAAGQAETVGQTAGHPPLMVVNSPNGINVMSLADPLNPVALVLVPVPPRGSLGLGADAAFYALPGKIIRLDLTNPSAPDQSEFAVPLLSPRQVAVHGGTLVVADGYSLQIFGARGKVKRRAVAR